MIDNWADIESEFDKIKNYKPLANKKLEKIGTILASAYLLDEEKADEMWSYLTEINDLENPSSLAFYVGYVFNKLKKYLEYEDAYRLLLKSEQRVRWQIRGVSLYHIEMMIYYYLTHGKMETAIWLYRVAHEEGFGPKLCYRLQRYQRVESEELVCRPNDEQIEAFFDAIREFETSGCVELFYYNQGKKNKLISKEDYLKAIEFDLTTYMKSHFFALIRDALRYLREEDILNIWLNYYTEAENKEFIYPKDYRYISLKTLFISGSITIDCGEDEEIIGFNMKREEPVITDTEEYRESTVCFGVELINKSETLLDIYFSKNGASEFKTAIIYKWIVDSDWDKMDKYLYAKSRELIEDRLNSLKPFVNAYYRMEERGDQFGREYRIINDNNIRHLQPTLRKFVENARKEQMQSKIIDDLETMISAKN